LNKIPKTFLVFLLGIVLLTTNDHLPKVSAATQSKTFPESTSRTQTHSLKLPNLKSVSSVSVNTGNVSYSVSGETVTFTFSNGAVSRTVQTGGTYTPADSKTVSTSRTYSSSGACSAPTYPSTIYYNYDGYSGILSKTSASSGGFQLCEADGHYYATTATVSYSGTVTRPASDTRTYAYYYQYTVTINYVDNLVPNLTIVSPTNNQTLSEVPGFNTYTISGQVNDADVGDEITVKYQVDSNPAKIIAIKTSTGSPQSFHKTITIDSTISEGNHVLKVWAEDNKGGISSIESRNFVVDKTPPAAPTFSENPIGQAVSKTVTINFPPDASIKEYKIDDGNWTTYTEPITLTKNATIYARAIDIAGNQSDASHSVTSIGPPNPIVNVVGLSENSVKVTDTQTYPEPVERKFSILKSGQIVQNSNWTGEEEYTFSGLDPNTIYDVQVDVRFK
jgi:hypothetical protein